MNRENASLLPVAAGCLLLLLVDARSAAADCFQHDDCADGNVCNGIERCIDGSCATAEPIPCDDGDPCTRDECVPSVGCSHAEDLCPTDCSALADGTRCIDGTTCTTGDACDAGACVAGPPRTCPDADPCTAASCDPVFGCVYVEQAVSPPCAAECTGTVADFTRCPGDGSICTIDGCLPSVNFGEDKCIAGLLFGRQCGDGDACNGPEWCSTVLGCQANAPLDCDDGDPCNGEESCDPQTGCQSGTALPDDTPCDDGRMCTSDDACAQSACTGTPLVAADCSDGDPTTVDQCREGFGCLSCRPLGVRRMTVKLEKPGGGDGRIKASGRIATGGSAVDFGAEGIALVFDVGGAEIHRAVLAAGALESIAPGKHAFKDATGVLANGLRSLKLKTRADGAVIWKASLATLGLDGPLANDAEAVMVAGAHCFRSALLCHEKASGTAARCTP